MSRVLGIRDKNSSSINSFFSTYTFHITVGLHYSRHSIYLHPGTPSVSGIGRMGGSHESSPFINSFSNS